MGQARIADLPQFKYHPGPVSTGAIEESDAACECCGQARGFMYRGPRYCEAEVEQVCPWCIADGSAHAKWDMEFTDAAAIGGWGRCAEVPRAVCEEVAFRTPGISAIQQARWWTHCGDAAQFLGIEGDRVRFRCGVCGKRASYQDLD